MAESRRFERFRDFYPFYLAEHSDSRCRTMHYLGSALVVAIIAYALLSGRFGTLWLLPFVGYGFAWGGHFFFEHNKPATFKYPVYSLLGDWVMFKDFLSGRLRRVHPALMESGPIEKDDNLK